MNLPNKLTMLRVFLIPIIVVLFLLREVIGDNTFIFMGVLFVIASVTDFFDGYIARKQNIVTTFGKFMDPLADKLLVLSALVMFSTYYTENFNTSLTMWMPFWVVIIVIARELIVTSIRLVAVGEGIILHASVWGKYKTAVTMVTLVFYFFVMPYNTSMINIIGVSLVGLSVLLTIGSGLDYLIKNKTIILKTI